MSLPNPPIKTDPVIGEKDSLYENTWDELNIAMQEIFSVEHDESTGEHNTFYGSNWGLCAAIPGTYQGNSDTDQVITVSGLKILFLEAWDETTLVPFVATAKMPAGKSKLLTNQAFSEDYIKSLDNESFTVTGDANVDGRDYFYVAYGLKAPTGNDIEFSPSWVQHDEDIDPDLPVRVSNQISERVQAEHDINDGSHGVGVFSGFGRIFIDTYTGDFVEEDSQAREISVSNEFTLKRLFVFSDDETFFPAIITNTMSGSGYRYLNNEGVQTDECLELSAHSFTLNPFPVNTVLNDTTQYSNLDYSTTAHIYDHGDYDLYLPKDFVLTYQLYGSTAGSSGLCEGLQLSLGPDPTQSKRWAIRGDYASSAYWLTLWINGTERITGTTDWVTGAWHTVTLQRINGTFSLYLDTSLEGSYSDSQVYGADDEDIYISKNSPWNGSGYPPQSDIVHIKNVNLKKATSPFNLKDIEYHIVAFGD